MTIRDAFDFAQGAIVHAAGEEVVYTRAGEDPLTIEGDFVDGFQRTQSGDVRVASKRPVVAVRLADFPFGMAPEEARGDSVALLGRQFEVVSLQADGMGVGAKLVLKES